VDAGDLKLFATVARTGGIGKAANELNTVQSNVTARLKALEERLGVALFERSHRGVVLTAAGQRLLPYAERIGHLIDDARRAVRDDGHPAGQLLVGSLETTAALRLSRLFARFAKAHPAVDISLQIGTSCELVAQVLGRTLDVAFVCGPVDHTDLTAEPVFVEELVLLSAPDVANLASLLAQRDLRIVVLRTGCSYRLILEGWLARHGIVGVRVMEFGTLETIVNCVGAGLGITLLPRALIGRVWRSDQVSVHALPNGDGRVETVLIRHRETYSSSALRAFLEMARPRFAAMQAAK
jgi:DNA-binding transcriptional LysR family regulator